MSDDVTKGEFTDTSENIILKKEPDVVPPISVKSEPVDDSLNEPALELVHSEIVIYSQPQPCLCIRNIHYLLDSYNNFQINAIKPEKQTLDFNNSGTEYSIYNSNDGLADDANTINTNSTKVRDQPGFCSDQKEDDYFNAENENDASDSSPQSANITGEQYGVSGTISNTSDKEKNECEVCHRFVHPNYFNNHMRIHQGEIHTCTICGKGFTLAANLNNHTFFVAKFILWTTRLHVEHVGQALNERTCYTHI